MQVRLFDTQYRRVESRSRYKTNDPSARDESLVCDWVTEIQLF